MLFEGYLGCKYFSAIVTVHLRTGRRQYTLTKKNLRNIRYRVRTNIWEAQQISVQAYMYDYYKVMTTSLWQKIPSEQAAEFEEQIAKS